MPSHEFQREQLLAEELTPGEVRALLERLDARSFGGSENATVGAVVESTGADVLQIGRILAEIRKEDFEERFGLRIDRQDRRIESLETRARRWETSTPKPESQPFDPYQQQALERLAERERQREAMRPIAIVIAVIMLLVVIIALASKPSKHNVSYPAPTSYSLSSEVQIPTADGYMRGQTDGKVLVHKKDGTTRPATKEEETTYWTSQIPGQIQ